MTDKKLIASIVKKLERAIGILDNCSETGELSDATRKRIIEMLNSITLEVYFVNPSSVAQLPNTMVNVETDKHLEEFVEANKEIELAPDAHQVAIVSGMSEVADAFDAANDSDVTEQHAINEQLQLEVNAAFAKELANRETPFADFERQLAEEAEKSLQAAASKEAEEKEAEEAEKLRLSETARLNEESEFARLAEELRFAKELEDVRLAEQNRIAKEAQEAQALAATKIQEEKEKEALRIRTIDTQEQLVQDQLTQERKAYSAAFELEEAPILSVDEAQKDIDKERSELETLRAQLELEKKRLDAEFQNWQTEKNKREQELEASNNLLKVLAIEEERRKQQDETKLQTPVIEPQINEPLLVETNNYQEQPLINLDLNRHDNAPKQEVNQTGGSLIDKFLGTKKSLHDMYETDALSVQGLTPIADLSKSVGINDRFQYIKELFGGDSDLYAETISAINTLGSFDKSLEFINEHYEWDKANETVKRMLLLIKRRYM